MTCCEVCLSNEVQLAVSDPPGPTEIRALGTDFFLSLNLQEEGGGNNIHGVGLNITFDDGSTVLVYLKEGVYRFKTDKSVDLITMDFIGLGAPAQIAVLTAWPTPFGCQAPAGEFGSTSGGACCPPQVCR